VGNDGGFIIKPTKTASGETFVEEAKSTLALMKPFPTDLLGFVTIGSGSPCFNYNFKLLCSSIYGFSTNVPLGVRWQKIAKDLTKVLKSDGENIDEADAIALAEARFGSGRPFRKLLVLSFHSYPPFQSLEPRS
jgi:hypothetical protein